MEQKKIEGQDEFVQGVAYACAELARSYGETSLAEYILSTTVRTIKALEEAGVDEYDLKALRPLFKNGRI